MRVGRWELVSLLGRGGMGEVWLGRDPARGEEVAVKRLLAAAPDGDALLRFQREAEVLLRLRHPAVVSWREAGRDEAGRPWVAMELVRGGTLTDLVAREGPLPPRQAAALLLDLCSGLAAVHACGALHRDIKPGNVLLDEGRRPKLTDFGLTRPIARGGSLTETGTIMGSPGYLAPEQVTGEKGDLGPASDVYGLGAVLFHLLTGQAPFGGQSVLRCLEAILRDPPSPPSRLRPEVPAALDRIVLRCLAKEPAARWPSALALRAALQGWLEGAAGERAGGSRRAGGAALLAAALALALGALLLLPGPGPGSPATEASARIDRGVARFRQGDLAGALEELDRALALDPGDARAWAARAAVREGQGDGEGALGDYERAIDRDPQNALVRADRGRLHLQRGELAEARADLDRAIELDPRDAITWLNRGLVRLLLKPPDRDGAVADFDRAIELDPQYAPAWLNRGQVRPDPVGALADFDRAIELDPGSPLAFRQRGALRQQRGDLPGALADLDTAIALDPQAAIVVLNRGELRLGTGDVAGAIADWQRFLELAPDHPHAPGVRERLEQARSGPAEGTR